MHTMRTFICMCIFSTQNHVWWMCVYFARDFRLAAPFYIVRNIDWTGGHGKLFEI